MCVGGNRAASVSHLHYIRNNGSAYAEDFSEHGCTARAAVSYGDYRAAFGPEKKASVVQKSRKQKEGLTERRMSSKRKWSCPRVEPTYANTYNACSLYS